MKVKGIKLSEVVESLELLKNLCSIHKTCTTCWLYDPEEKETACFLMKAEEDSLAGNIEAALRYTREQIGCIEPEMPYCPTCGYGHITYPEDTMPGEKGVETKWHCLYDPEVKKSETVSIPDSVEAAGCADQDDRSDP